MYLYKKNIILVPADYDGESMAKGILSLDCYADKTVCSLRTYNLFNNSSLTLGIAVNKQLSKTSINGSQNSQKLELPVIINNADNISVVLLDINQQSYNIVLWGSTELNSSWRSTLEFMLEDEFNFKNKDVQNNENNKSTSGDVLQNLSSLNYDSQSKTEKSTQSFEQVDKNSFEDYENFETENFKQQCLKSKAEQSNFDLNTIVQSSQDQNLVDGKEDIISQSELLKDQNLDEFLDSVLSLEQEDDDQAIYDENSSHLEEPLQKEDTFYNRISYQIEKMFASNLQEKMLDEIIPNSKFCRVEFDDNSGYYVFGIVYDGETPKYLCYGVPAKKDSEPPKELSSFYQWLPVDIANENGDGYYMMYQDALTGKNISVEII